MINHPIYLAAAKLMVFSAITCQFWPSSCRRVRITNNLKDKTPRPFDEKAEWPIQKTTWFWLA